MGKQTRARNKDTGVMNIKDVHVTDVSLLDQGRAAMKQYGEHLIENRALPDFRDGLLPVYRRILYAMYEMGTWRTKTYVKSAKVVGTVLGNYHPHGDNAVYGAVTKLVQDSTATIDGQGNWGSVEDLKAVAAMRYTEALLNNYSVQAFFQDEFMQSVSYVPNFDGTTKEPLFLNCLLPNILLNSSFGIGVGITCSIPPFELAGLVTLIAQYLSGGDITAKDCAKHLKFNFASGGRYANYGKEDQQALLDYFETGDGNLHFESDFTIDEAKRQAVITGFAPQVNILNGISKIDAHEKVDSVVDESDMDNGTRYVITLKRSVAKADIHDTFMDVLGYLDGSVSLKTNYTERYIDEAGQPHAKFIGSNIPDLIKKWADYRVGIEKSALNYGIKIRDEEVAKLQLMILAANSLDIIVKALKRDDTEEYLAKQLKITDRQVKDILAMTVGSLKKLNVTRIQERIEKLEGEIAELRAFLKRPKAKVVADMKSLAASLATK